MGISMGKWPDFENHVGKFPFLGKLVIFKHVAKGRQWSSRVSKVQGPWTLARGTPGMGEMSYNQIDHI